MISGKLMTKNALSGSLSTQNTTSGALSTKHVMDGTLNNVALRGYSAYQVAVNEGFKGTEQEWLESLKGKDGVIPVKNVDYWTETDKAEIVDEVMAQNKWITSWEDIPDKPNIPSKTSELENDSGFITLEDVPKPKEIDLSGYALKTEIPTDYAKENHKHDEYLTEHQSLEDYAKKTDIPTDYAKQDHVHDNYALKDHKHDEYLTEHQSLAAYALKNEIPSKTSDLTNDSGFITIDDIPEPKEIDLSGYALKSEIPADYAKEEHTHSEYANKEHTHEQYLTEHQDLSSYAKISDVTTHNTSSSSHNDIRLLIEGLTTRLNTLANSDDTTLDQMAEIVEYIKNNKSLIDNITTGKVNVGDIIDDLTSSVSNKPLSAKQGVVLKGLIDDLTSVVDGKASKEHTHSQYLTQHQDLSGYALKTDIPTDYAKEDHIHDNYSLKDHKHAEYLTEHQSLEDYALKSEIPDKISKLTNDSGYITLDEIINTPEINDDAISTVDTWSSKKISEELANAGSVKTINGVKPDANGNVEIQVSAEDVGVDLSNYYTKLEIDNTIGSLEIPDALSDLTGDSTHRVVTDVQISSWNAKSNFSGSYTDLTNKPTLGSLASKSTVAKTDLASDVQTSLGKADTALQSFTETDPTVPAWAKAATKPIYTASEVGAVPTTRTVNGKVLSSNITLSASDISDVYSTTETDNKISGAISTHNGAADAHNDIRATLAAVKEDVDAFFKGATISTEAKDTLKEIQDYITSDASAAAEMTASINNKVDKVSGKGLSTNDLTAALKSNYDAAYTHTSNKSNPHGVTLSQLGVTATAAELNVLDGITATVTELNYVDGVTSNVQTQLNAKVPISRTINSKALNSNITLSASDVGAYSKTEVDNKLVGKTAIQIITWEADD